MIYIPHIFRIVKFARMLIEDIRFSVICILFELPLITS